MKIKSLAVIFVSLLTLVSSCASNFNKNIEDCLFALDKAQYASAVTKCQKAVNNRGSDEEANMYLSAAYAGRAGVDILEIEKQLSETSNEETAFRDVHAALVGGIGASGLPDLRSSIVTLSNYIAAGYTPIDSENFYGQFGLLEAIEAFALPSLTAQPVSGGTITPTSITDTEKGFAQTDFIDSDDYLVTGGWGSDHQLMKALRKNYCVLKNITGGPGFTTAVLRDQVLCQLTPDPTTLTPADFEAVAACSDFNFSVCTGTDPNVE